MSAVAILPARGGSRRIPRKNVALFHGRPMISYPIAAAKESGLFDGIVVSTDDFEISSIANKLGVLALLRDPELAKDEVGTQAVVRHVLTINPALSGYDFACCIYPCTPLMTANDLRAGFSFLQRQRYGAFACIPGWFYFGLTQDFLAGSPLTDADTMPLPKNWIDINTPEDWEKAEGTYMALHP